MPEYLEAHGLWNVHWILPHLGPLAVEPFVKYLTDAAQDRSSITIWQSRSGKHRQTRPVAPPKPACLKSTEKCAGRQRPRRRRWSSCWRLKDPSLQATLEDAIEKGMAGDARDAVRFSVLAAQFAGGRVRERLWQELAGKSKLRRDAAAEALAAGSTTMPSSRRRHARRQIQRTSLAARARCWASSRAAESIDCLLHWIPREDAEKRYAMRSPAPCAKRASASSESSAVSVPLISTSSRQQAAKIEGLPGDWLSESDLPPLRGLDGQPLGAAGAISAAPPVAAEGADHRSASRARFMQ